MAKFVVPSPTEEAYTCPFCHTLAQMVSRSEVFSRGPRGAGFTPLDSLQVDECGVCAGRIVWWDNTMLRPDHGDLPDAHEDMPAEVSTIYYEAASINSRSARAAAALLRLAMEALLRETGRTEGNLNEMIGVLAASGLPVDVVKAMDLVRLHGNDRVHAGQIAGAGDSSATVAALAGLLNFVTDQYIGQPKRIRALYDAVPDSKREAIEKRNDKQRGKK